MNTFHGGLPRPGKFRHVTAAMFLSAALATSLPGFCGPIHDAARDGDVKKVELLIKNQPSLISSKDEKYGQTPLHVAAFNDRLDVAKLLIEHKADVNAKATNGSTPLHLAAAKGNKDIVEMLIENKADVNAVDNDGWSPTHSAVTWGQKDVEDLLSKNGGKDLPAPKPAAAPPAQSAEKAPPKETTKDGQFTAYDDGTVVDTKTNLVWAARDNGAALSWLGAKAYAKSYHAANYTDWRLPTVSELAGLYDKAKTRRTYCQAAVDELGQAADEVHVTETIYLSGTRVFTSQEPSDKLGSVILYDFHSGKDVLRPATDGFTDMASRVLLVRDNKK
jgi:hypothetical protein